MYYLTEFAEPRGSGGEARIRRRGKKKGQGFSELRKNQEGGKENEKPLPKNLAGRTVIRSGCAGEKMGGGQRPK